MSPRNPMWSQKPVAVMASQEEVAAEVPEAPTCFSDLWTELSPPPPPLHIAVSLQAFSGLV